MAIPDWLARLQAQGGAAYTDPTSGQQYIPMQTNGPTGPQDGYASIAANTPGLGQYVQNDYNMYDGQGNQTGTKKLGYTDDPFVHYMPYLIAAAAGAGAAGAYGGAGAGIGESGTLANGVTVGGPMSVGGATGTELGALGAGAGGATTLGASGGGGGLMSLLGGSGAGGMGGLLGPAATLLGGMLGSKGQQKSETTTKDIPDFLKPSVAGLLTQTDALRNKQMQPGYMQGYDDMRTQGQSLLNAPIAGNGVGKVAPTNFGFKR